MQGYEIPAFVADSHHKDPHSGQPALNIPQQETVYSMWIGTNDVGNNAFLTDSQIENRTLADYVECVYSALDRVFANGGRYFVLMNLIPLQDVPQYAVPERGGQKATKYWPNKGTNLTEISYRMQENVVTLNEIFKYKTAVEVAVNHRYPGAHFALFDTYSLV